MTCIFKCNFRWSGDFMALAQLIFIACLNIKCIRPLWIFMECIYQLLILWFLQLIDAYWMHIWMHLSSFCTRNFSSLKKCWLMCILSEVFCLSRKCWIMCILWGEIGLIKIADKCAFLGSALAWLIFALILKNGCL